MTKAFREAQMKEKLERYPKVRERPGVRVALLGPRSAPTARTLLAVSPALHPRPAEPQLTNQSTPFYDETESSMF